MVSGLEDIEVALPLVIDPALVVYPVEPELPRDLPDAARFPPGGFPEPWHLPFHATVHYRHEPSGGVFFP